MDGVSEAARAGAVGDDPAEVDVGDEQLLVVGEALGLGQRVAVLVDHRLAVPGQVGGRLSQASRGVQVGGDRPRGLRAAQAVAVVGLADGDVAGREVGQHRGPGHGAVGAGRDRRPQVFADLHVQGEVVDVATGEEQVGSARDGRAEQTHLAHGHVAGGAELALLVVLAVLGQVALGNHPEDRSPVNDHGGVEQATLALKRTADDDHREQRSAGFNDPRQRVAHGGEQSLLVVKILDRVAGEAELREERQPGARLRGPLGQVDSPLGVELRLGDPDVRNRGGHPDEAVPIQRAERGRVGAHRSSIAGKVRENGRPAFTEG